MSAAEQISKMTYREYAADFVNTHRWDEWCDEMYWERNFNSDELLNAMELEARENGVELTDGDSFDYDKYFYDAYQNTEKGLS
jgi:hypothetical protein